LSNIRITRVAGALYLVIIAAGLFGELFVRAQLVDNADAATTAANILASTSLFRAGFMADAIMVVCDIAIAVLLYVLLKPVNKTLSLTAAVFRLTQAAVLSFNLLIYYAALLLLTGTGYMSLIGEQQQQALSALFLDLHAHGYDLGLLFFAVSNVILGYLIVRSKIAPVVLGYGLIAAAVVYLAGSLLRFLAPAVLPAFLPAYVVPLIAELSFAVWLLTGRPNLRSSAP
jgi:hypothetical protein